MNPMPSLLTSSPASMSTKIKLQRGFTLVEVMITLTLFILMSIGVFGSITVLHQISRRQATYSSVLALVIQKQEAIRADGYTTPSARYTSDVEGISEQQEKSVSWNASGTESSVDVTIVSTFKVASGGHLVTVSATYIYNDNSTTIETTTLINNYSSTSS